MQIKDDSIHYEALHAVKTIQGESKKVSCYTLVDNFGKYGPISIILSLLQSVMNCGKYGNKSCHLTSNMLPHYNDSGKTKWPAASIAGGLP